MVAALVVEDLVNELTKAHRLQRLFHALDQTRPRILDHRRHLNMDNLFPNSIAKVLWTLPTLECRPVTNCSLYQQWPLAVDELRLEASFRQFVDIDLVDLGAFGQTAHLGEMRKLSGNHFLNPP